MQPVGPSVSHPLEPEATHSMSSSSLSLSSSSSSSSSAAAAGGASGVLSPPDHVVISSTPSSSPSLPSDDTPSAYLLPPPTDPSFQRRRAANVANFLREGERNDVFRNKAPSILPFTQHPEQSSMQSSSSYSSSVAPSPVPSSSPSTPSSSSLVRRFFSLFGGSSSPPPLVLRSSRARASLNRSSHTRATADRASQTPVEQQAGDDAGEAAAVDDGAESDESEIEGHVENWNDEESSQDEDELDNFATVDWVAQNEYDLLAYHRLMEPVPAHSVSSSSSARGRCGRCITSVAHTLRVVAHLLQQAWRACQGWLICAMVGGCTGLIASIIDMAVHWVIDLRQGTCKDSMFLSNLVCCAAIDNNYSPERDDHALQQSCPLWQNWPTILGNAGITLGLSDYWLSYLIYVLISGCLGVVSAWLVRNLSPYAAGSGIPEIKTILGGVVIKQVLGAWTLLVKCVALVLSVSSGLSVGKEGPFVHIAASIGQCMCKIFPRYRHNQSKTNEILSAACAAGVAVAFGAPIGGILYSLEEVSSYFPHKTMWRAFFCAIIASLSVQYIDPFQEGKLVQFQIEYTNPWAWFEMVPFAMLGILGGLAGAFFIRANLAMSRFRKSSFLRRWPLCEVGIVAAMSSCIKFLSAFTRGNTTNLLEALFGDCSHAPSIDPLDMCNTSFIYSTLISLLFTTLVTLLLTTYSIGLPVPSGLLIPSLTTGAAMGRLVGTLVRWFQLSYPDVSLFSTCLPNATDCITPGIYALVGAAAVLGGVTRMTVALVVIMFEITGGLTYLLPIMVAVVLAKVVGDSFGHESIYEGAIEALKYPFLDVKHEIQPNLKVKDAMSTDLLVLPIHGHTVASLQHQLLDAKKLGITGFPIVTTVEEMLIVGYISRLDLSAGLSHALVHGGSANSGTVHPHTPCYFAMLDLRYPRNGSYVDLSVHLDPSPVQIPVDMALYRLHDMFCKLGLRYCLVTRFGKVVGIITKKDILNFLQKHAHLPPEEQQSETKIKLQPL